MNGQPALILTGIAKLYGRTAALRAVTLRQPAGTVLLLLGPNGAGKTTLLKIVAGAMSPTVGTGTIFGYDLVRERPALRAHVGLLASESYLYDDLSADENLRFVLTMAGRRVGEPELGNTLDAVGLAGARTARVRTFSSGMQRRLALARLLLLWPQLLLLDEPYTGLDADGMDLVDGVVRRARTEGRTVILTTHDAARGLALADQVAVLERGALAYCGPAMGYMHERAHHVG